MSRPPPPPCRYHNLPNGCKWGSNCKFFHASDTKEAESSLRSPSSASPTPRSHSTQRRTVQSNPPKGVCRFYWEQGSCKQEFNCRFDHTHKTQTRSTANVSQPARRAVATQPAEDLIAPFLTEKGLAKLNGSGTDGFFAQTAPTSLTPTEAHNRLKRFLDDKFNFSTALQVYSFLIPLSSANAANRLWVSLNLPCSTSIHLCFLQTQEEGQVGC
jgi:hypothetical protein